MNTNNNYSYKLATIIEGISSWSDLEARIAGLPTEMDRGNAFEEFCHAFFIIDPVFQFKEVYRQKEIPPSILARLGYPGVKDIGIDGVALSNSPNGWATVIIHY